MNQHTITTYLFSELAPKVQTKVIDKYRYNFDYEETLDYCKSTLTEESEKKGYQGVEIEYSGFYSQGDGASFTCKSINIPQLLGNKYTTRMKRVLECWDIQFSIDRGPLRYVHERSCHIYSDCSLIENNHTIAEKTRLEIEQQLEQIRLDECIRIYKALEAEYSYDTSDEHIVEMIENNEMEFFSNGDVFTQQ